MVSRFSDIDCTGSQVYQFLSKIHPKLNHNKGAVSQMLHLELSRRTILFFSTLISVNTLSPRSINGYRGFVGET